MPDRREALAAGVALLAVATSAKAQTAPPALPYRRHTVRTPDGLAIAAYEYGNPTGRPILLIHGYAQAALSWDRQAKDAALARDFRMVAYDLRGHGMSDKPEGERFYKDSAAWAGEVRAVIEQLGLERPVLAGWSYGGRVICDYLMTHGAEAIAGVNFVDATTAGGEPGLFGPGAGLLTPTTMLSEDPATFIASTNRFLRMCFETQPEQADFETMLGFNMMVPRHVRMAMGGRPAPYDPMLRALNKPVLVTHGERDQVVLPRMAQRTAEIVPKARLSLYPGVGHAPFWEAAPRFNAELAAFVRAA